MDPFPKMPTTVKINTDTNTSAVPLPAMPAPQSVPVIPGPNHTPGHAPGFSDPGVAPNHTPGYGPNVPR